MMEISCIERIVEEIKKRINFSFDLPYKQELEILLKILKVNEKILLGKYFCTLEWNIGSSNVLSILQKCNLLTSTEYILRQTEYEHIQLVFNDLLETKFELLANIVTNCYYDMINSAKLTTLLEECFSRLFHDLFENPNALTRNYITDLKGLVQDDVIFMLKVMHINVLLLHEYSTLKRAISDLHLWRHTLPKDTFLHAIVTEITNGETSILEHILKRSLEQDFKGWKFYIVLLEMMSENCTEVNGAIIKRHLKELFKQFLQQKDERYFYMLLLTARTVYKIENSSNLDTYSHWFKTTIGDMNYVINSHEFRYVMATLSQIVLLETECIFLEIQTNTGIAAPPLCNQIVLSYKKLCRRRISSIKGEKLDHSDFFDLNDSIVIDDD